MVKFGFTNGSRVLAKEKVGNKIVSLCCFYILDTKYFLDINFEKYRTKKKILSSREPTILGCRKAIEGILCYEQWVTGSNPVGEVMASEKNTKDLSGTPKKRFSRREGTQYSDL